ncbi:MAG TPA: DinB family protein, partial [Vicinamibacterales bacterium]|nr:DinB family protein [Vicinamibacterales bacterium]
MNPLLRDLYGHQVWADAEHFRAIGAHPAARGDKAILVRLHHIAIVQRAFLWAVGDRQDAFEFTKPEDFASLDALKRYVREHHDRLVPFIATVSDLRLAESIAIPWFKDPPLSLTVAEALTQGAMHSHYHRGQNATRLREIGGEPPMTDYIVWLWKVRPEADWTDLPNSS